MSGIPYSVSWRDSSNYEHLEDREDDVSLGFAFPPEAASGREGRQMGLAQGGAKRVAQGWLRAGAGSPRNRSRLAVWVEAQRGLAGGASSLSGLIVPNPTMRALKRVRRHHHHRLLSLLPRCPSCPPLRPALSFSAASPDRRRPPVRLQQALCPVHCPARCASQSQSSPYARAPTAPALYHRRPSHRGLSCPPTAPSSCRRAPSTTPPVQQPS